MINARKRARESGGLGRGEKVGDYSRNPGSAEVVAHGASSAGRGGAPRSGSPPVCRAAQQVPSGRQAGPVFACSRCRFTAITHSDHDGIDRPPLQW